MNYDYLLLAAAVLMLLWQFAGLISTGTNVRVAGRMPGQVASLVLVAVLIGAAIYRNRARLTPVLWAAFGIMALVMIVFTLMKHGLGDEYVYHRGRRYGYDQIEYYHIERESGGSFIIRLHTRRRELMLQYPDEKKDLVMEYMGKFNIMSFDSYKASGRR